MPKRQRADAARHERQVPESPRDCRTVRLDDAVHDRHSHAPRTGSDHGQAEHRGRGRPHVSGHPKSIARDHNRAAPRRGCVGKVHVSRAACGMASNRVWRGRVLDNLRTALSRTGRALSDRAAGPDPAVLQAADVALASSDRSHTRPANGSRLALFQSMGIVLRLLCVAIACAVAAPVTAQPAAAEADIATLLVTVPATDAVLVGMRVQALESETPAQALTQPGQTAGSGAANLWGQLGKPDPAPPTPPHTGLRALAKAFGNDLRLLPSIQNLTWVGIGVGAAAAVPAASAPMGAGPTRSRPGTPPRRWRLPRFSNGTSVALLHPGLRVRILCGGVSRPRQPALPERRGVRVGSRNHRRSHGHASRTGVVPDSGDGGAGRRRGEVREVTDGRQGLTGIAAEALDAGHAIPRRIRTSRPPSYCARASTDV